MWGCSADLCRLVFPFLRCQLHFQQRWEGWFQPNCMQMTSSRLHTSTSCGQTEGSLQQRKSEASSQTNNGKKKFDAQLRNINNKKQRLVLIKVFLNRFSPLSVSKTCPQNFSRQETRFHGDGSLLERMVWDRLSARTERFSTSDS